MNRIRVLMFVADFSGGGAEKMTVNIANGLDSGKYEISLIVLSLAGELKSLLAEDVRLITLQESIETLNPIATIRKVRKIRRQINALRPEVILSNGSYCNLLMILANGILQKRSKLLIRETNVSVRINRTRTWGFLKIAGYKLVYRYASVFIAPSQAVLADFQSTVSFGSCRQVVIPNFVDADLIDSKRAMDVDWSQDPLDKRPVLVSMGRLVSQKDVHTGLKAFRRIRNQIPCRYVILGSGPQLKDLQEFAQELGIADDVSFMGFKLNPYPILSNASVMIHPSIQEGYPNVLLEAFYLGVPVVAARFNSSAEDIVLNPPKGAVVETGDDEAMANAVLEILSNDSLRKGLKENIHSFMRSHTKEHVLLNVEELFREDP